MAKHRSNKKDQKHGRSKVQSKVVKPQQKQKKRVGGSAQVQQQHSILPYGKNDRILLVGEGDFSFAASLVKHHGCRHITATSFDSEEELARKYPQTPDTIKYLQDEGQRVLYSVDATKLSQRDIKRPPLPPIDTTAEERKSADNTDDEMDEEGDASRTGAVTNTGIRGPRGWDVIAFNFPHVGGKSTDVNRQVRHNQALILSFFERAMSLMTPPCPEHPAGGVLLVTLFEGEPYTLWNIKDLGRHVGMRSERSWKFDWGSYPGYSHARTLGNIEGGGGWKGEERLARTYAFISREAPTDTGLFEARVGKPKKREKGQSSDDEED